MSPSDGTVHPVGDDMHRLLSRLFPICRSITGDGVRRTLAILQEHAPIEVRNVATGTKVFDWDVPREWNIREAWIKAPDGRTVVDFRDNNLHVVGYSTPIRTRLPLAQLKPQLHALPDAPDAIPYLTSYYNETWGFCLTQRQLDSLGEGIYEVCIDSSLAEGQLTYGECFIPGRRSSEFLISCYLCHPSMANDGLSGVVTAAFLARHIAAGDHELSYRILFVPETIGAITWLALNEEKTANIAAGLVVTCCGDAGPSTYKKSRRGDAVIDRAALHVLKHYGAPFRVKEFFPSGSDERQYCSPGFDLPVGSLMRTPYWEFPQYHTSLDDLELVRAEFLEDTLEKYLDIIAVVDGNRRYRNLNPKCEPRLGKRGLYNAIGGQRGAVLDELPIFWVLNLSDGEHTLLDIAERADLPFTTIKAAADVLVGAQLLAACN